MTPGAMQIHAFYGTQYNMTYKGATLGAKSPTQYIKNYVFYN